MSSRFTRWRRRLAARFAAPQRLFLTQEGQVLPGGQPFADWCAAHAGSAVELIVSARLLHELVCDPQLPLQRDDALRAYAQQQFGHYFGAAALRWPLAAWQAGTRRGATALHGLDWAALLQAAAAHEVDLRSARPAWAPLLQRLEAPQESALAWVEGELLSWLQLDDGEVRAVRQQRLSAATPAALAETLRELRGADERVLLAGCGIAGTLPALPGVRLLGRLDGTQPALDELALPARPKLALPLPDFLGQRPRPSLLAWPLALTGLLVLTTAGWSAWTSHRQRDAARDQAAALQDRVDAQAAGRRALLQALPPARGSEAEARLRAAGEAQALLQQRWEPLLANVEQAGASAGALSWLAMDYNAARGELRLEGLVQDKAAALALVDRLAAAPGWRSVVLSRFQAAEAGLAGQRFELGAALQTARMQRDLPPPAQEGSAR